MVRASLHESFPCSPSHDPLLQRSDHILFSFQHFDVFTNLCFLQQPLKHPRLSENSNREQGNNSPCDSLPAPLAHDLYCINLYTETQTHTTCTFVSLWGLPSTSIHFPNPNPNSNHYKCNPTSIHPLSLNWILHPKIWWWSCVEMWGPDKRFSLCWLKNILLTKPYLQGHAHTITLNEK